jgi:hypothetical protein
MEIGIIQDYVDLRLPVLNNIVVPNYLREINDVVKSRHRWRKIASAVEASAQIVLAAASVLAFSGGFFENPLLTYFAACCTTLCMALGKLSTYAESECVERNTILTRLLERINIGAMPSISSEAPPDDSPPKSVIDGLPKSPIDGLPKYPTDGLPKNSEPPKLDARRAAYYANDDIKKQSTQDLTTLVDDIEADFNRLGNSFVEKRASHI